MIESRKKKKTVTLIELLSGSNPPLAHALQVALKNNNKEKIDTPVNRVVSGHPPTILGVHRER